ncbi:hypothetical protein HY495_00635 [Candidatus Woesearchaeota archaeon]|nr:hypothetical protein [Candidatus Woesearchaeota archaeon]
MTLLLSLRFTDGVLLAADCLTIYYPEKLPLLENKIHFAINQEQDSSFSGNGLYLGFAGLDMTYGGSIDRFLAHISRDFTRLGHLTVDHLLDKDCFQLQTEMKNIKRGRAIWELSDDEHKAYFLLDDLHVTRAFVHTSERFLTYQAVRMSPGIGLDLLHIKEGKVLVNPPYAISGSGAEIVSPFVESHYHPHMSSSEAVDLACTTMNKVLEDSSDYKGYSLVHVEKTDDIFYKISTAIDIEATSMQSMCLRENPAFM